jgi:hypothetical protein
MWSRSIWYWEGVDSSEGLEQMGSFAPYSPNAPRGFVVLYLS